MSTPPRILLALLATLSARAAAPQSQTVPLFFVANQGQAPDSVRFMAQGSGMVAWFLPGEARFELDSGAVRVEFGATATAIEGVGQLPGTAHFLIGPASAWHTGVPLYSTIVYRSLYPGIDMRYGASGRDFKSDFLVAPGADPSAIRLRYSGADLALDDTGALVLRVNDRELREDSPIIYQDVDGARIEVSGSFTIYDDGAVGFTVNDYDRSLPLVIDPVLSYSTLLGGSSTDSASAIAVDATGAAYIAGFTASRDFPTANPSQNFNAGSNDVFVAKLNPAGNGLIYCTYLGGTGDDRAYGIALDAAGEAYVTGSTTSTNFPLRSAAQSKLNGYKNAFLFKLNAAGNGLIFSTYLGGNGSDTAYAIATDTSGNAFITGDTTSITFPTTVYQRSNRGSLDAFVAKFSAAGSLLFSTYLGGSADDHAAAIAIGPSGSAYIAGYTYSTDFPLANAMQGHLGGGQDAFVTRMSSDGSSLIYSTFLGGSGGALGYPEAAQGIAVDSQDNAFIAGVTSSKDFPLLAPLQTALKGSMDAFITRLNSSGALVYSTYLGGLGTDTANAIAVDSAGFISIAGQTLSSDLPVANPFQSTRGGDYDAFWARLSPAGDSILALSYLGGSAADTATSIALDSSNNIYLAGYTLSTNFPVLSGYQSTNAGNYGAFIAKIVLGAPLTVGVSPSSGSGSAQTFSFQFSDAAGASNLTTVQVLFAITTSTTSACSVTYTRAANTLALFTDTGASPSGTITPGSGSQQNTQCTLNGVGSSVTASGNVLTLNLSITFQGSFAGAKNVYLQATNPVGSSGWQQRGTWTVTAGPPASVSVTPSSGSGTSQVFSFVFSDPKGYAALTSVSVIINGPLSSANACYLFYTPANNKAYVANDAVTTWLGPITPGQAGTAQNSQCMISGTGSSATGSGNNLTLNLSVTFLSSYTGTKNIYLEAYDGTDSGWAQRGTWTVSTSGPPAAVTVTPNSGSGSSQTFSFVFTDPKGYAALTSVSVIINATLYSVNACYLFYQPAVNKLYVANDAVTTWLGPVTPGQAGTAQNSQCMISGTGSSVSTSGNNLTLNVALTFQPSFAGAKNTYLEAYDGVDSGWAQLGAWTVPAGPPSPVSVTPSSGSGSSGTFSFLYSDPRGYTALTSVSVIVNATLYVYNGCYLFYQPSVNKLYVANDAVTTWLGPVTPGQAGTAQNSQCTISGIGSSVSTSGNNLTLNVALTFQPSFTGAKNIYMEANDGQDSGWIQRGTWTVQ